MRFAGPTLILIAAISVGAVCMRWYDVKHRPVCPPCQAEVVVMRTKGGLLEVATLRKTERFTKNWVYSVAGVPIGHTVNYIQVPAYYTYRIKLAPEWRVLRTDKVFTVVTPPLEPKIPVAVDFSKMQKHDGGTWVLARFNNAADMTKLERGMTKDLQLRANDKSYLNLARDAARKTVAEFVRKWLMSQAQWQRDKDLEVRVLFADEPIGESGDIYTAR